MHSTKLNIMNVFNKCYRRMSLLPQQTKLIRIILITNHFHRDRKVNEKKFKIKKSTRARHFNYTIASLLDYR